MRIEVGPRDMEAQSVMLCRRDQPHKEKATVALGNLSEKVLADLDAIQRNYYEQARQFQQANIRKDVVTFDQMREFFTAKNLEKPEIHGGFVLAKWCGAVETEKMLEDLKVTVRCLPLNQSQTSGTCVLTGRPATLDAIFAKSY